MRLAIVTFARRIGLVGAIACVATAAAFAAEPKPDAAINNKNIEAEIFLEPKLLKIGSATLAPSTDLTESSGLTFHYPPYAVGPYAEGEYIAFVPWEALKPFSTAEGAKIFGSVRPEDDDGGMQ